MTRPVRPWAALAVLCLGNFLILLDTSIVNTAAPNLMTTLDASLDELLWVLNGYLLALSCLLIVFSRVGDRFGPRRVFIGGLTLFGLASLACGLAGTPAQLIAARVAQGVGAAALLPQALVLISAIFPAQRRGAALGIFTAVAGVAAVAGPTLGGLLVTSWGWPWIFFINVPLAAGGIAAARGLVPDLRTPPPRGFDVPGVVLATAGLFAIVYALIEGERRHWGPVAGIVTIPGLLTAGVLLLVLFLRWESRRPEPLVPLRLFRDRTFAAGTAITLITSFALYGFLLVFVIETQTVLGMSPLVSGLTALPWTFVLSAVAPVAGRLTDRVGGRILLRAGLFLYALGVAGVAVFPQRSWDSWSYAGVLAFVGLGMGLTIAPTTTEALRGIAPEYAGPASGVLNTARQVGAALGAAVIGAVLQNQLVSRLSTVVTDLPDAAAIHLTRFADDVFAEAFLPAARWALLVAAGVLLLGSILTVFMRQTLQPGAMARSEKTADAERIPA